LFCFYNNVNGVTKAALQRREHRNSSNDSLTSI